jgi:CRP-like cAMP-binding protein
MFNQLKNFRIFSGFTTQEIEQFLPITKTRSFTTNEIIFEEGEVSDDFFFIVSGKIDIIRKNPNHPEPLVIRTLSEGDYFGEMGFVLNKARSAGAKGTGDGQLLILSKRAFSQLEDGGTIILSKLLTAIIEILTNRFLTLENHYLDTVFWSTDIGSPLDKINDLIKNEQKIKLYYGSQHKEVVGRILSINADTNSVPMIRFLVTDSSWELLIPLNQLESIVTRYQS